MLIADRRVMRPDVILDIISGGKKAKELQTGVYEVGHFGCSDFLQGFEDYPEFGDEDDPRGSYGVCDSVEQLLAAYPELEAPGREFVVVLTAIHKSEQSSDGGWRWHKWGPYIGTQNPQHEYIYDEPNIDVVYVYHIYEKI